ncbi:MAG: cytochrome c biogenesis protein ResB, partial [Gallionella sp.]|nr:cytochrome c biogenesis protein ResB [Gallionella sp.]
LTFGFTLLAAFFPAKEVTAIVRSLGQILALDSLETAYQLNFQERFESPTFMVLMAALSLSLCFSLYFRIKSEFKRRRAAAAALLRDAGSQDRTGPAGAAVTAIERELKQRGYQTRAACTAGKWQVHASKGGSGVWGSVLFHVGILLVFAAIVLSVSASFRASVKLTEGQAFDARVDGFGMQRTGRWYTPASQPLTFRLIRVEPEYEVGGATTLASIVEPTLEGKSSRFAKPTPVHINHGLRHAGVTIHQGVDNGYAPLVMIEDSAGKRVYEGYTRLATLSGPEKESYLDYVEIPDNDKKIRAEFELFPDAVFRDGVYLSKSGALKNPVLHVVLRQQDKVVFDEFLLVTREASAGGYTVFFGNVRRWTQLDFSDAPGVPVLVAATVLGSLGLMLRLLRVRRRIVVSLFGADQERTVKFDLAGSCEKFPHAFEEELDSIRAALAQQLAAAGHGDEPALQAG